MGWEGGDGKENEIAPKTPKSSKRQLKNPNEMRRNHRQRQKGRKYGELHVGKGQKRKAVQ